MSAQYDVTLHCPYCDHEWETWGISWTEPPTEDGFWILGRSECSECDTEGTLSSVNNEADDEPSLTIGERNA